ncbi:alpha/beta fold hydrolase [Streptomyces sp. NPDC048604]|uniref:alpha/beta fold hydrolase n=1 Tax=Streptomyces sp. NPDC048604 TaxID=3365578 RepID=UPI003723A737
MEWQRRTVVRDGVALEVRDSGGDGPPVLLLHGLAGQAGEWDATARLLGPRHRVVAVDQRGHGASERRPADVSRAAYVADVVAVLDALDIDRAVLAGQSLGGHTALLTAAAHPDRAAALVLVDASPGGPHPESPGVIGGWLDSWPVPFASRAAAVEFLGGGAVGEGWAGGLEERADGWWPRFDRDVMVAALAENATRSWWREWEAVVCPTLVLLAQDSFVDRDEADEMLVRRPQGTYAACVPGTGHDLHLERPDALHAVLAAFLAAVRP